MEWIFWGWKLWPWLNKHRGELPQGPWTRCVSAAVSMIGKRTRLIAPRERTCSCFLFEVYIEMERQLRIGAHALKHSCFSVRGVWWCDPRRGGNCKFEVLCNYIQFTPTRGGVTRIPCSCREASICVRRCGPRRQPGHALALPR